jgi:hypothetical protein
LACSCEIELGHDQRTLPPWSTYKEAEGDQTGMFKTKMIITAIIATFAVTAMAAASASAATAGWMVGGTQLVGSAALATTAAVDERGFLSGGGVELECTGTTLKGVLPAIEASNKGSASSLTFTGCSAKTKNCTLASGEVTTVPVSAEATLETGGVAATFSPKSGTLFATFKFNGESCAVSGLKAVTGKAITKTPGGQEEKTLQLLSVNTTATEGVLKLGSAAAKFEGSALLKLASGLPWSFL